MRMNPAMLNHLMEPNSQSLIDASSGLLMLLSIEIDEGALTDQINTWGSIREDSLRNYLTSIDPNYSLMEFRLNTLKASSILESTRMVQHFDFILAPEPATFVNPGLAKSFVLMRKEEVSRYYYNSSALSSELIVGSVGKIGDEVESDLMLKETLMSADTELVKNDISVTFPC